MAFSSLEAEDSFLNLSDQLQSYFCGLKFMTCCALLFQAWRCWISQAYTKVAWTGLGFFSVLKFDFTFKDIWNNKCVMHYIYIYKITVLESSESVNRGVDVERHLRPPEEMVLRRSNWELIWTAPALLLQLRYSSEHLPVVTWDWIQMLPSTSRGV